MENRQITIATLNKSDAFLFSKQLESHHIECVLTTAQAVKANEPDGTRVKVKEKDRKIALRMLDQFSKTYGIKECEQDIFFTGNRKNSCTG
jgi:hypothetical protein